MNKKILIFIPSIEGGGVEKNLFLLANFMAAKFDIEVVTVDKEFKSKFNKNIKIVSPQSRVWKFKSRFVKYLICSILLIKKIIKNKENLLIFCFQGSFVCLIIAKLFSKKIILRPNSAPSGWISNIFQKKILGLIYSYADIIIVNSKEFKKEFYNYFKLKAICIYNPLNKKKIISLSKKKITNKFYKKNSLNLINIGRFTDQKDHLTLLKAIKLIPNNILYKLLIIGRGKNFNILKKFVSVNKLSKNVKFINYTKNPYPYLKKSDVFILSSKFEGLPNVLLESILLNNYIISTNCKTGPAEILDNGKGGALTEVGDYKKICKEIIFFHQNKNICLQRKKFSKIRLNRFDEKKNLKKYLLIIEKLLNKK